MIQSALHYFLRGRHFPAVSFALTKAREPSGGSLRENPVRGRERLSSGESSLRLSPLPPQAVSKIRH